MIPAPAVKAFLARERRDVRPLKKATMAELSHMKDELPVKPPIWRNLQRHQRVCFLLGAEHKNFGFHLDMGMGKSLLGISLARYFQKAGMDKRVLVLAPTKISKVEWARELRKWGQRDRYVILKGSSVEKWETLRSTDTLFVVETYAGFVRMMCELTKVEGKKKRELKPVLERVAAAQKIFGGLLLDESTHVASRAALATRICGQLKKTATFMFQMTGMPFGKDPTMLHSQLKLIDDGFSLGETLGLYRAAFFSARKNYWGGWDFKFKRSMEGMLNRCLAHATIRYEVAESDLPAYVPIVKRVMLPHDAEVYARKAIEILRKSKGQYDLCRNAFMRMRQISSGWLGYEDDTAGVKAQLEFDHNPKMELLLDTIESTDAKVIIFHDFIFSGTLIERELTKKGIGWARIGGETKEHAKILADFQSDPKLQCLILNNKMTMGPNLQAAQYGIWFEAPCSCIERKQGRRRFERQHSEHKKVFGIDLVVENTFDQRILDAHAKGEDLFQGIIAGRIKV